MAGGCKQCGVTLSSDSHTCPNCGKGNAKKGNQSLVGLLLAGKYRIDSVLGRGGMGDVYLATHTSLDTKVVIKTLRAELAQQKHLASRFFREAKATSELRHPNCVQIIDFGESEGRPFIAMEYLKGETLADMLKREGKLEPLKMIDITCQILDCVETAHRLSIVHRDLKPSNVMLVDLPTRKDFVKVVDFGIAKITDPLRQDGHQTKTGHVLGTPAYMAPEQAQGRTVDGRTDLYAIAVISYRALSGRFPFSAKSSWGLLAAQITKDPTPLGKVAPDLPPNLAALIDRGLMKEPRHRPQTALEFKNVLEQIASEIRDAERGVDLSSHAPPGGTMELKRADAPGGATTPNATSHSLHTSYPPCPRCGAGVPPAAKFCSECGASTAKSKMKTGIADRFSDLRRYLPSALVDELSVVDSAGPAEQREVVVMSADFTGRLLEEQDSSTTEMSLIGNSLEAIAVRRAGHLERRHDGSLAVLFGLTMSHGDDVERALRTALELRDFVQKRTKDTWRLATSIAIHMGEVTVRQSTRGIDYESIGDTISLPTRLSAALDPGSIIVTDKVRERSPVTAKLKRTRPIHLKAQRQPVQAYDLLGMRGSTDGSSKLPEAPLVGRSDQVQSIGSLIVNKTEKRLIHITGEPGSGKSRFALALAERLVEAHQSVVHICADDETLREKVSPVVEYLFRAMGGTAAALTALGAPETSVLLLDQYRESKTGKVGSLGEVDSRLAVAGAVRTCMQAVAERRPISLVVDDVQNIDAVGAELLRGHVRVPMDNVGVVATSRPDYTMPWAGEEDPDVLAAPLPLLSARDIGAIVKGVLSPSPVPPELTELVASRAGGSPLLALEILRTLVDSGMLRGSGGRWEVAGDLASVKLPARLADIIGGRVDALPAYARDVLACASALGLEFHPALVDKVLSPSRNAPVDKDVILLTEKGFFQTTDDPNVLRFGESTVRDAVYARLPPDARTRLHGVIGAALETAPDEIQMPLEEIGRHLKLGGDNLRALFWYQRAATEALQEGNQTRACKVLRRCLRAARDVLELNYTRETALQLAENTAELADASLKLGNLHKLLPQIEDGLLHARKLDEASLIARLLRLKGRVFMEQSHIEDALEALEMSRQVATGIQNASLEAEVHADIGEANEKQGEYEDASRYLLRALELIQQGGQDMVQLLSLRALTALGRVSLRSGHVDRAERFFDQALSLAESLGEAQWAARLLGNIGGVYHAREDYDVATEFVERALDLSQDCGDQIGAARLSNNLGTLHLLAGNAHEAQNQFSKAYELAQNVGWREGMAMASAGQAQVRA